jgi:hypothetical protein
MLAVVAKNSIDHKERIIHAESVEGPKDLLNGRPLHISWGAEPGTTGTSLHYRETRKADGHSG